MSRSASPRPPRRLPIGWLALALFASAAPTAGDVGSCGQPAEDLDAPKFFGSKQALDCRRCDECGISSPACDRACAPALQQSEFAAGCYPLVHDGEVCLDALQAASCTDYASYLSTDAPSVPTECDFCPAGKR